MESELIREAYTELEKLRQAKPCWDTYNKIAILQSSISYLQQFVRGSRESTSIDIIIDEMVNNVGESATIDFLKRLLNSLKDDMDLISPQLSACMIKKLKGRYTDNGV